MKVVANGDIVDSETARRVIQETGCDGLMVGRECLRRPWILAEIASELCGHPLLEKNRNPVLIALRQVELAQELISKPEKVVVRELRGQLLPYRLGAPIEYRAQARSELETTLRNELVKVETFEQLFGFLERARTLTADLYWELARCTLSR
jgi:tRNA-dihydrouridine synthase